MPPVDRMTGERHGVFDLPSALYPVGRGDTDRILPFSLRKDAFINTSRRQDAVRIALTLLPLLFRDAADRPTA